MLPIAKKPITGYHLTMILDKQLEDWANGAAEYFKSSFGLEARFALLAARLYISLWAARLNPRITSGWRDPKHQQDLIARWDRGDRVGLRVRPAEHSRHSYTNWLGRPAAEALDMPCDDDKRAAGIAQSLGIGTGQSFSDVDPGHYYLLGGAK